jgi:hypothetical protein
MAKVSTLCVRVVIEIAGELGMVVAVYAAELVFAAMVAVTVRVLKLAVWAALGVLRPVATVTVHAVVAARVAVAAV